METGRAAKQFSTEAQDGEGNGATQTRNGCGPGVCVITPSTGTQDSDILKLFLLPQESTCVILSSLPCQSRESREYDVSYPLKLMTEDMSSPVTIHIRCAPRGEHNREKSNLFRRVGATLDTRVGATLAEIGTRNDGSEWPHVWVDHRACERPLPPPQRARMPAQTAHSSSLTITKAYCDHPAHETKPATDQYSWMRHLRRVSPVGVSLARFSWATQRVVFSSGLQEGIRNVATATVR